MVWMTACARPGVMLLELASRVESGSLNLQQATELLEDLIDEIELDMRGSLTLATTHRRGNIFQRSGFGCEGADQDTS